MRQLILFEDDVVARFLPMAWTRPVFDLRCGIWTLREAIEQVYKQPAYGLLVREYLQEVAREQSGLAVNGDIKGKEFLLLNGRLLADSSLPERLPLVEQGEYRVTRADGRVLAAYASGRTLQGGWEAIDALPARQMDGSLLEWPWEIIGHNGRRVSGQAESFPLGEPGALEGVYLIEKARIFIHPSAQVMPGVVIDASQGPVVVDEQAVVMANTVIEGPTYIGKNSRIKIGAKIYEGTSIGPTCKIGGEVEAVVVQGFSNKQHDGFLGHAYLGEWCNLGAGTSNSDLKNNYGAVSVWSDGAMRNTGATFVGVFMGDHSKTGINSSLNTGTVVGVACNIFGAGVAPKFVPSFLWGGGKEFEEYDLERALGMVERVMARRNRTLSEAERRLLTYIHEQTRAERAARLDGNSGSLVSRQ